MIGALTWIIGKWQMLLLAGVVVSLLVTGIYLVAYERGKSSVINKIQTETIEKIVTQREVELIIKRMPKNDVQKLLEDKWCRDCQ